MQQRMIPVAGAVNLRDFGGYATSDGRKVRSRKLFRSGALAHLTVQGQSEFAALDVRLICDLRRADEKAEEPTALPANQPQRLEIPIDPGSAVALRAAVTNTALSVQQRIDFMVQINRELVRDHADDYARMFEGLLAMADGGFLVHCAAGKDRTGVAVALILHALGVPEQTVMEDYLLTNEAMDYENYLLPRLRARLGSAEPLDRTALMALAGVRPEYLQGAYAAIAADFNSVEHYIEAAIGLDAQARATLQRRFVS